MEILYKKNGVETGPVSLDEIKKLVEAGDITNETLVRRKHITAWITAREMFALDTTNDASFDLKEALGLVLDAAGLVSDVAEALSDFSGTAKNMKNMINAFTPDKLKNRLIAVAMKNSKDLSSKDEFRGWYAQQVSLHGDPIALASGNVLNGFPKYIPLNRIQQFAGDGASAEIVIMQKDLVLYDPSFKPGAWKTIIPRKQVKMAKEGGMNGERIQLTTNEFQANFEVDFDLGGRALGSLIEEWRIGIQKCPHCGYEGPAKMRPAPFKSPKFGLTKGGFYLMLATTFFSCGFLIWLPLVLTSLRRKVISCSECHKVIE